jgi:hypothetical protein
MSDEMYDEPIDGCRYFFKCFDGSEGTGTYSCYSEGFTTGLVFVHLTSVAHWEKIA